MFIYQKHISMHSCYITQKSQIWYRLIFWIIYTHCVICKLVFLFVCFYLVALQAQFCLWFLNISFVLMVFLEKKVVKGLRVHHCFVATDCHLTLLSLSQLHMCIIKPCRQHLTCNSIRVTPLNSSWPTTSCFQAWGFSVLMVNLHSFRNTKPFVLWSLQVNKWKVFALV